MNSESPCPSDSPTPDLITAYKPQVKTSGDQDWVGNGLTFRTEAGAQAWVDSLFMRWTAVKETRVLAVDVPPADINRD